MRACVTIARRESLPAVNRGPLKVRPVRLLSFRRFDLLVTLGCVAVLGYFAWDGLKGPRGLPYLDHLHQQQASLSMELDTARKARAALEARVKLMRPESVDPDLLDQMARDSLDMARPGDLVVRLPD